MNTEEMIWAGIEALVKEKVDKALTIAANVSQIEIDEYKAKIDELEKHLAHYADVNQNQ